MIMTLVGGIKRNIFAYMSTGVRDPSDTEALRKSYLINSFILFGIIFVFPLGMNALSKGLGPLGLALLLVGFVLLINYYYLKTTYNQLFAAHTVSFLFFVLIMYLVYHGGVENTGPLWVYILPMVLMFLLGFKRGILYTSFFLALIALMLFSPDEYLLATSYPFAFKLRIFLSLLIVTFLAGSYEYFRATALAKTEELSNKLKNLSKIDYLTNIYNRRGIHKELEGVCSEYKHTKQTFALILCDIDFFKKINDTYGHTAGDEILKNVALEIKSVLRKEDCVARWGGEEFLILLPDSSLSDAHEIAERIRKNIEKRTFFYEDQVMEVTVSMGISSKENEGTVMEIINQADKHMYCAKKEGRNMVYPTMYKNI